ncbi:MAG TPA: FAD binding domain-containing protein [Burkholderiales bacterium]|nr:FAD binding domain-containing protein [Burkholderiales bacterium]
MKLPAFEYAAPRSARDVVELLAAHRGAARIIAGGQSLLPMMAFRLVQPELLVDLRNVPDLQQIAVDASGIALGARTRWCDIEANAALRIAHPLLTEAVRHIAHYQIRNRGTVGGSLAHADPASELPCIVVTCEAAIRVLGSAGERVIAADDFLLGPLTTALTEDEIILEVRLPAWPRTRRWGFRELSSRAGDFALAGLAVFYDADDAGIARNAHVGMFGGAGRAVRLPNAEQALNGTEVDGAAVRRVAAEAAAEAEVAGDIHASADYRRSLVATLCERALSDAAARANA